MRLAVVEPDRCVGCQCCMFACARRHLQGGLEGTALSISSAGGMSRGFKVIVCRSCRNPPCARVCPTGALRPRKEGGVQFTASLCIGCGHCRENCIIGAVFWNDETNKPVICVYCGYCVGYCPHGVLQMEHPEVTDDI